MPNISKMAHRTKRTGQPNYSVFGIIFAIVGVLIPFVLQCWGISMNWWLSGVVYFAATAVGGWSIWAHATPDWKPLCRNVVVATWFVIIGSLGVYGTHKQYHKEQLQDGDSGLKCQILDIRVGRLNTSEGKPTQDVFVTITMRIVNNGSPSTAWGWHLKATLKSGKILDAYAEIAPSRAIIGPTKTEMPANKYLPNILLENPIVKGDQKLGWADFIFRNANVEDMQRSGTKFFLEFEDTTGNKVSDTIVLTPYGKPDYAS
jgi:hypothetical protein